MHGQAGSIGKVRMNCAKMCDFRRRFKVSKYYTVVKWVIYYQKQGEQLHIVHRSINHNDDRRMALSVVLK